jgi:hypothetical protein
MMGGQVKHVGEVFLIITRVVNWTGKLELPMVWGSEAVIYCSE